MILYLVIWSQHPTSKEYFNAFNHFKNLPRGTCDTGNILVTAARHAVLFPEPHPNRNICTGPSVFIKNCFDQIKHSLWLQVGESLTQVVSSSLVPRPCTPPGKKRSGERSLISWAYYPKRVMTNEIARSVIIMYYFPYNSKICSSPFEHPYLF